MKQDIHPKNYREVVFKDMSNDEIFITRSTVAAKETIEVDGKEYPLVKLEITSSSHPFFTGQQKLVDTAGRVEPQEKISKVSEHLLRQGRLLTDGVPAFFVLPENARAFSPHAWRRTGLWKNMLPDGSAGASHHTVKCTFIYCVTYNNFFGIF